MDAVDAEFNGGVKTVYSSPASLERLVADADVVIGGILVVGEKAPKIISENMIKSMRPVAWSWMSPLTKAVVSPRRTPQRTINRFLSSTMWCIIVSPTCRGGAAYFHLRFEQRDDAFFFVIGRQGMGGRR